MSQQFDPSPAPRENAVANSAAGELHTEGDGWFKISPYGEFPGMRPGRPQFFTIEQAANMVAEFNSVLGRLGRMFRGIPIYRGHPDVDLQLWPDDRRIGRLTALDARADGLWGRAEWNSVGKLNITEGFWVYPSPRWDGPAGGARFEPDRLLSVGLTNTPRIEQSEPVSNAATPPPTTEHITNVKKELICQKLGLDPAASDDEVLEKLAALAAAASNAAPEDEKEPPAPAPPAPEGKAEEIEKLKAKLSAAEAALESEAKAANSALLGAAQAAGSVPAADVQAWAAKLDDPAQRAEARNALAALKPAVNTAPLTGGGTREDRGATDDMRERVANAVEALEREGKSYAQAWAAVKRRPEFAAYFQY